MCLAQVQPPAVPLLEPPAAKCCAKGFGIGKREGGWEHYTSMQFVNTEYDGKGAMNLHTPSEREPALGASAAAVAQSRREPFNMTHQPREGFTCILNTLHENIIMQQPDRGVCLNVAKEQINGRPKYRFISSIC